MLQKDYILKMIEMAASMIAGILGRIKKRELKEASLELARAYNNFLREDSSFFQAIPAEEITDKLLHDHNYTNGHLEILAELLNAEGELELALGKATGSLLSFKKSLILFEFIDKELKTYSPDRLAKIDHIRAIIKELES